MQFYDMNKNKVQIHLTSLQSFTIIFNFYGIWTIYGPQISGNLFETVSVPGVRPPVIVYYLFWSQVYCLFWGQSD